MNYKEFPFYQQTTLELIFNNTVEIYRKFFGWLFFFSFLFLLMMNVVSGYLIADKFQDLEHIVDHPELMVGVFSSLGKYLFICWLGYSLYYLFIHYFIIIKYLEPEKSHGVMFMDILKKYYLKYLIITLLSSFIIGLGTMIGILAFIIGSVVAAIFLGVSLVPITPILIVEETGIWETIKRSFRLVLKDFWQVLGFLIIFYLIYMLFSLIFGAIAMAPYAGGFFFNMLHPAEDTSAITNSFQLLNQPVYLILNSLLTALITPLVPVFTVLIYFHLKFKEDQEGAMIVEG
ncbi:MAG TPA: hypothetical protein ENK25_07960 [Bacteroidetes bacterium]|nr:hypothetical protein [Bacteroidota bacterium]